MSVWRWLVSVFLPLGIIVAGVGALVVWSRHSDRFPLRTVEVRSELKYVKESDIKTVVLPFLSKGFFWLDVRAVQEDLNRVPWVQSTEIRRLWPDKLLISVREKTAQARWGEKGILSTEGAIFYPAELAKISEQLPRFVGPEERGKEMLQQYLTFLEVLGPLGLAIKTIDLSANGSWQMMLDNGVTIILGKMGLQERLTRFVLAYQSSLQGESQRIAYVDLRYTNGFAIGWKAGVQR